MRLIPHLFLIFTISIFTACKEPEVDFVFLENATSDVLQLTAEFETSETASKPLVFNLDPGQRDGWRYIAGEKGGEKADSTFHSLLIKSEKCARLIDRSTIEKRIRKNGAWILRIDEKLFFC